MHLPDYDGGSIVNLTASLIEGLDGKHAAYEPSNLLAPSEIGAFRNVVLIVLDGLGHEYLCEHQEAKWLNANLRGRMTSVFPPTTATAITTFLTGDAPAQHGLTGWHMYFRELGNVIAVLPGRPRGGGVNLSEAGVPVEEFFDHKPLFDRFPVPSTVVSPAYIAKSDFNLAHLGSATSLPYVGLGVMFDAVERQIQSTDERQYIYAYWPELDGIGHEKGMGSSQAREHLLELDRALNDFTRRIEDTDTLMLITADHGHIDTSDEVRISMDDHPQLAETLVLPLCGESRSAWCYVRAGREKAFERYVAQHLDHAAWLYPSSDLIKNGWFGPGAPHPALESRIGDYALIMKDRYVIKDWLPHEHRHRLIGVHGGVSASEVFVPLVTWSSSASI